MNNGPLDMRMDPRQKIAAKDVVNDKSEEELARILHLYGEVQGSRHLSRLIIENRPYATTQDLATVISNAIKGPKQPKVLAQVFQALRIVVNDELNQLKESLPLWIRLLKPKGRLVVISFHSLEDRIVKQYFAEHGGDRYDSEFVVLTRQPIVGSPHEIVSNPRARSAKLRAVAKK
jgi:16S rRNA (cytosine1402-N4)-methyltransferase